MTKTIVIGKKQVKSALVPIEISKILDYGAKLRGTEVPLSEYGYVELICLNYDPELGDLMFAYDDPNDRSDGCLLFGKWNDGIVE